MVKTIIVCVVLVAAAIFSIRAAIDRSKSNKTSLFGNMNGEYREDNLGKMTPAALEGLEEAARKKAEREAEE
ncbi:MAG: FeoB-associated Cys-rich membrane protein [Firmicutes bacterium]|nr:FeoB-associated Cys-rich membrane protein [Bacillota bacterium]